MDTHGNSAMVSLRLLQLSEVNKWIYMYRPSKRDTKLKHNIEYITV